jgi:hypothetical protein
MRREGESKHHLDNISKRETYRKIQSKYVKSQQKVKEPFHERRVSEKVRVKKKLNREGLR